MINIESLEKVMQAGQLAQRDLPLIEEPNSHIINASGDGRFRNPFGRDGSWALAQILDDPHNFRIDPRTLLRGGVVTLMTLTQYQSDFGYAFGPDRKVKPRWPGKGPHELHTKYTPAERVIELKNGGFKNERNDASDGFVVLANYSLAEDVNSLMAIAIESGAKALDLAVSPEFGDLFLKVMWPPVEAGLIHDISWAMRKDKLLRTLCRSGEGHVNKTWRDSHDAFISDEGIPDGEIAFYENNVVWARGLRSFSWIAERLGYFGAAESSLKLSQEVVERIHELFWMEEEGCFAAALNHDGRKPIRTVTNESLIGLFTETIYPEIAPIVAKRMMEDDLSTDFGTRTRSSDDPYFRENDQESYHRGTVWLHMDTTGVLGARKYGLKDLEDRLTEAACNFVIAMDGCAELGSVPKDGTRVEPYHEGGVIKGCKPQTWGLLGMLAVAAPYIKSNSSFSVS